MRRFYAHPRQFNQDTVTLDPGGPLHLVRVLRLSVGARVERSATARGDFAAQVTALEPRGVTLRILGKQNLGESPLPLVLGIGLRPKGRPWTRPCAGHRDGGEPISPLSRSGGKRLTPERVAKRLESAGGAWPGRARPAEDDVSLDRGAPGFCRGA